MVYDMRDLHDKNLFMRQYANKGCSLSPVGVTSGCFDLFHVHHLEYLKRCCFFLGIQIYLIVGIDSDRLVTEAKGVGRPIISAKDRASIVNSCEYVHDVFIMDCIADHEFVVSICDPMFVFKNEFVKKDAVYCNNAEYVVIPDIVGGTSTTEIINKIRNYHN